VRAAVLLAFLALVVVLALWEWREHRTGRHVASRGPNRALRVLEEPRAEPIQPMADDVRGLLLERCREVDAMPRGAP
jgi:hypothetical protein